MQQVSLAFIPWPSIIIWELPKIRGNSIQLKFMRQRSKMQSSMMLLHTLCTKYARDSGVGSASDLLLLGYQIAFKFYKVGPRRVFIV